MKLGIGSVSITPSRCVFFFRTCQTRSPFPIKVESDDDDQTIFSLQGGCSDPVGDNIADTPPQASGTVGCPIGKDSCKGKGPDLISCVSFKPFYSNSNLSPLSKTDNFMDYSYDSCMDSFTELQIKRMHESIRAFRNPGAKSILTSNSTATVTKQSHWQW